MRISEKVNCSYFLFFYSISLFVFSRFLSQGHSPKEISAFLISFIQFFCFSSKFILFSASWQLMMEDGFSIFFVTYGVSIFSRVHVTLYVTLSVRPLVRPSVCWSVGPFVQITSRKVIWLASLLLPNNARLMPRCVRPCSIYGFDRHDISAEILNDE